MSSVQTARVLPSSTVHHGSDRLRSKSALAVGALFALVIVAAGVPSSASAQCVGGGTAGGTGLVPQISIDPLVPGQSAALTVSDLSPTATRVFIGWQLRAGCTDVSSQFGPGALLVPDLTPDATNTPPFRPMIGIGISHPSTTFVARVPQRWAGLTIFVQAFVEDQNALSGGFALSNGVAVTVSRTSLRSSLSQFGITWTFDHDYPVGLFANGDWWVVGPTTIIRIDPESLSSGARTMNGSMLNPNPTTTVHGYDSRMYGQYDNGEYQPNLNLALDVSQANPLVLRSGSSLVSTISEPEAGAEPQIRTAAILTVLDSAPAPGSFRPPYCGSDKTVQFNRSQLQTALLASLAPIAETPSLAVVERYFERPWIDHIPGWLGRYHHPADDMPDYGRDLTDQISTGALMLQLNFSPAQKQRLLVRYVQLGIDLYGIVRAGGIHNWTPNGGHGSGRKWPILFAGLMLADPSMSAIGFDSSVEFGEDGQTFYVQETSAGVFDFGYGGYDARDVGTPEWGIRHSTDPTSDAKAWYGNAYRTCCTANAWWGVVLSARIMGVEALWNHDALFDYLDRYRQVCRDIGAPNWQVTWSDFPAAMWDAYRSQF
ncbi:MAG: hypothetical protein HY292_02365 [Planctomycetes bacterium]|nr:hypothetical protein [Planctomycetota bacterium]